MTAERGRQDTRTPSANSTDACDALATPNYVQHSPGNLPSDLLRPILEQAIVSCEGPRKRQQLLLALKHVCKTWAREVASLDEIIVTSVEEAKILSKMVRRNEASIIGARTLWIEVSVLTEGEAEQQRRHMPEILCGLCLALPHLKSLTLIGSFLGKPGLVYMSFLDYWLPDFSVNLRRLRGTATSSRFELILSKFMNACPALEDVEVDVSYRSPNPGGQTTFGILPPYAKLNWGTHYLPLFPDRLHHFALIYKPHTSSSELADFIAPLSSLSELTLPRVTESEGDGANLWKGLSRLTLLEMLVIEPRTFINCEVAFAHLATLPHLRHLTLSLSPTDPPVPILFTPTILPIVAAIKRELEEGEGRFAALKRLTVAVPSWWIQEREDDTDEREDLRERFGVYVEVRPVRTKHASGLLDFY